MLEKKNNQVYIYGAQILLAVMMLCGIQGFNIDNVNRYLIVVARFTAYELLINGFNEACFFIYSNYKLKKRINLKKVLVKSKQYIVILVASIAVLLYNKIELITEDLLFIFIAYLITKYPEINQGLGIINYGVGMACSFFEGYLVHVIPSDGHKFVGFEENIAAYEARHNIVFPVKKLIIIITKSLFCPPELKYFNKTNKNLPYLEECPGLEEKPNETSGKNCHRDSLSDVEKNVAGVVNRIYRNSAYKIHRAGARAVYVSAECASPLHTLRRVMDRRALYHELVNVDLNELRDDFCEMLKSIISRSPEARGKCELVFFDDEDPSLNLADVLLDKIRELEPDFENIISKHE